MKTQSTFTDTKTDPQNITFKMVMDQVRASKSGTEVILQNRSAKWLNGFSMSTGEST